MIFDFKIAKQRSEIIQKIRNFFTKSGFLEVETPILVPIPGMEPHLNVFKTKLKKDKKKFNLYLNHSPELQMKKLLGAGSPNIFTITKTFRNSEYGGNNHNPEFTMCEWYRNKSNYFDLMQDCQNLIQFLDESHYYKTFEKKSCQELFEEHCQISLLDNQNMSSFRKAALKNKLDINGCETWDDIFFKLFLNHIEPTFKKIPAIFVYDYPSSQAALAKKKKTQPFFAERFELYLNGIEVANAYSELINSDEQRSRLIEEQKIRKKLKKEIFDIDEEFLASLDLIKNPCSGIALGVDRLIMTLLKKEKIDEVLLFPITKMMHGANY